jgi:TRAP-type C4-dicarboxylate transport system substrate-binding protein
VRKSIFWGPIVMAFLALALVACSGKTGTTTTTTTGPPTTGATTASAPTVAETTTTAAPQEPITLKFATSFGQTEPGGQVVQHFCDYVEEETAGVVTFDIYFGGELGASTEELGLASNQQVDMVSLGQQLFGEQLPLLSFPASPPPDAETGLQYYDKVVFQDSDTAPLIRAEAARNNVLYLGFMSGGGNVLISKTEFSSLADLAGKRFGVAQFGTTYETLGLGVVDMQPADIYDGLSNDAIDAVDIDLATALKLKLYEAAQNFAWDGTYAAGNVFTINLDSWDQLTADTQRILNEAAQDAAQFSLDLDTESTQAELKTLSNAGVTVDTLSSDDQTAWWKNLFAAAAADCMTRAKNADVSDSMATVLEAAANYSGLTWTP